MKNILAYVMLAVTFLLTACDKDEIVPEVEYLPVTYANIAGTWKLAEWNGTPLSENRYCYLVIERRPDDETGKRSLKMYMNIDSNKSHLETSTYELTEDEDSGTTSISGLYDYGAGFWTNTYVISELESDRMVWTVSDDAEDVSVYVRCEEVPEEILNGTRSLVIAAGE